jgi:hypothetical protein
MIREGGHTIVELLVAGTIGLLLLTSVATLAVGSKLYIRADTIRSRISQNARSALGSIGSDVRLGGQFVGESFPAFELINGGDSQDKLIIRRKLIDESLTLCTPLVSGQTISSVGTSRDDGMIVMGGTPVLVGGCIYSGAEHIHQAIVTELTKQAAQGHPRELYLYNPSTREGEFLTYQSLDENPAAKTRDINVASKAVQRTYPVESRVMILEQLVYQLNPDEKTLDLVINERTNPNQVLHVAADIYAIDGSVMLKSGVVRDKFEKTDPWKDLQMVSIKLFALEKMRWSNDNKISREVRGDYFPRNILSEK